MCTPLACFTTKRGQNTRNSPVKHGKIKLKRVHFGAQLCYNRKKKRYILKLFFGCAFGNLRIHNGGLIHDRFSETMIRGLHKTQKVKWIVLQNGPLYDELQNISTLASAQSEEWALHVILFYLAMNSSKLMYLHLLKCVFSRYNTAFILKACF